MDMKMRSAAVNKAALIREALGRLGAGAATQAVVAAIKKRHGVDVSGSSVSQEGAMILDHTNGAAGEPVRDVPAPEPKRSVAHVDRMSPAIKVIDVDGVPSATTAPDVDEKSPASVADVVRAVRAVIAAAGGKDQLKELVDLL